MAPKLKEMYKGLYSEEAGTKKISVGALSKFLGQLLSGQIHLDIEASQENLRNDLLINDQLERLQKSAEKLKQLLDRNNS